MVNFEVKSTFLFPLDQAIPRGFLLCELHHLRRSSLFSDHSFFHPLALFLNHSSKASAMELSECCALYFYFYFLLYFFLLIYFTLNVFFSLRCAHVQKLFFSYFLFTIFCGRTPEFFSPLFFFYFLQALHYFSLNIIYKFAFNTHTLLQLRCCGTRTHKIKSSFSPLHWGCQTQLKSCDLVTRFRPDLRCPSHTHTHTWLMSWSSPFCLGFTAIAPPSRPLFG